jgi:hypothetical protein
VAPGDEPRHDGRSERDRRAGRDGLAQRSVGPDEAGREGREHEDGLEPFAKDQERAVHDDGPVAQVGSGSGRIGDTVRRGDRLPGQRGNRSSRHERPCGTSQQQLPLGDLLDCRAAQPHL